MTQIMAGIALPGAPATQGGSATASDAHHHAGGAPGPAYQPDLPAGPDPPLPLLPPGHAARTADGHATVASSRHQQTKIDGAPDTVLADAGVVAIVRKQQEWAARAYAGRGARQQAEVPVPRRQMNRNGDRPYSGRTLRTRLSRLAPRLEVPDAAGALVDFNRTHRFRHTAATSLLNSGVPVHVVKRYMGHLTPAMTMHYAQTLQSETAEAEFLRYRKLTADARDAGIDPTDLYDMLQLGSADRPDAAQRVLPAAAPTGPATAGNACLTCDKFATDAHLPARAERPAPADPAS